jgi:hypothetical protein
MITAPEQPPYLTETRVSRFLMTSVLVVFLYPGQPSQLAAGNYDVALQVSFEKHKVDCNALIF